MAENTYSATNDDETTREFALLDWKHPDDAGENALTTGQLVALKNGVREAAESDERGIGVPGDLNGEHWIHKGIGVSVYMHRSGVVVMTSSGNHIVTDAETIDYMSVAKAGFAAEPGPATVASDEVEPENVDEDEPELVTDGGEDVETVSTHRPKIVAAALREGIEQYRKSAGDPSVPITRDDLEHLGELADELDPLVSDSDLVTDGGVDVDEGEGDVVAIVGCGSAKLDLEPGETAPVRELYTSGYFSKKREFADALADRWYVLSAEYALVKPWLPVETYEKEIGDLEGVELEKWQRDVGLTLLRAIGPYDRVVVLGGRDYVTALEDVIAEYDLEIDVVDPFAKTSGIGDQNGWMTDAIAASDPFHPVGQDAEEAELVTDGGRERFRVDIDVETDPHMREVHGEVVTVRRRFGDAAYIETEAGETHLVDEGELVPVDDAVEPITDGGRDVGAGDLEYWTRELEAFLERDGRDLETYPLGASDSDGPQIRIAAEDLGRDERAELIHRLDRAGFTTVSTSDVPRIVVKAGENRLEYPYSETSGVGDSDLMTDGGQAVEDAKNRVADLLGSVEEGEEVRATIAHPNAQGGWRLRGTVVDVDDQEPLTVVVEAESTAGLELEDARVDLFAWPDEEGVLGDVSASFKVEVDDDVKTRTGSVRTLAKNPDDVDEPAPIVEDVVLAGEELVDALEEASPLFAPGAAVEVVTNDEGRWLGEIVELETEYRNELVLEGDDGREITVKPPRDGGDVRAVNGSDLEVREREFATVAELRVEDLGQDDDVDELQEDDVETSVTVRLGGGPSVEVDRLPPVTVLEHYPDEKKSDDPKAAFFGDLSDTVAEAVGPALDELEVGTELGQLEVSGGRWRFAKADGLDELQEEDVDGRDDENNNGELSDDGAGDSQDEDVQGGEQATLVEDVDNLSLSDVAAVDHVDVGDTVSLSYSTPHSDYDQNVTGEVLAIETVDERVGPNGTPAIVVDDAESDRKAVAVTVWPAWDSTRSRYEDGREATLGDLESLDIFDQEGDVDVRDAEENNGELSPGGAAGLQEEDVDDEDAELFEIDEDRCRAFVNGKQCNNGLKSPKAENGLCGTHASARTVHRVDELDGTPYVDLLEELDEIGFYGSAAWELASITPDPEELFRIATGLEDAELNDGTPITGRSLSAKASGIACLDDVDPRGHPLSFANCAAIIRRGSYGENYQCKTKHHGTKLLCGQHGGTEPAVEETVFGEHGPSTPDFPRLDIDGEEYLGIEPRGGDLVVVTLPDYDVVRLEGEGDRMAGYARLQDEDVDGRDGEEYNAELSSGGAGAELPGLLAGIEEDDDVVATVQESEEGDVRMYAGEVLEVGDRGFSGRDEGITVLLDEPAGARNIILLRAERDDRGEWGPIEAVQYEALGADREVELGYLVDVDVRTKTAAVMKATGARTIREALERGGPLVEGVPVTIELQEGGTAIGHVRELRDRTDGAVLVLEDADSEGVLVVEARGEGDDVVIGEADVVDDPLEYIGVVHRLRVGNTGGDSHTSGRAESGGMPTDRDEDAAADVEELADERRRDLREEGRREVLEEIAELIDAGLSVTQALDYYATASDSPYGKLSQTEWAERCGRSQQSVSRAANAGTEKLHDADDVDEEGDNVE